MLTPAAISPPPVRLGARPGRVLLRLETLLTLVALSLLAACATHDPASERFEFTRLCMGVQTRIILYVRRDWDEDAADQAERARLAAAAAFDRIGQLDALMSDYRPKSQLSRLNAAAGGPPLPMDPDLFDILSTAAEVSRASGGAFDVTVGPAVQAWRAARRREGGPALPSPEEVTRLRALIDWRRVELDPLAQTARLTAPGMAIDLGGIAKGYAAQRAVDTLRLRGHPRCLVALSGDIVVGDPPPGSDGWRINLAGEAGSPRPEPATILIANAAISTSGDSNQFIEIDGVRYAHIVNPETALGARRRRSATVIAPRGELADALAKPAFLQDPLSAERTLLNFPGSAAIIDDHETDHPPRWILNPSSIHWPTEPPPSEPPPAEPPPAGAGKGATPTAPS